MNKKGYLYWRDQTKLELEAMVPNAGIKLTLVDFYRIYKAGRSPKTAAVIAIGLQEIK